MSDEFVFDHADDIDRIFGKLVPVIKGERKDNILLVLTPIIGQILSEPGTPADAAEQFFEEVRMAIRFYQEESGDQL